MTYFLADGFGSLVWPEQCIRQEQELIFPGESHLPLKFPAIGESELKLLIIDFLVRMPADFLPATGSQK